MSASMSVPVHNRRTKKKSHVRAALLAALRRDVAELVRQDHVQGLRETLNGTHFDSMWTDVSCREIGAAIMALAPLVANVDELACVVHTAAYHRHIGTRETIDSVPQDRMVRELAEYRAQTTLDRAGPYVLARFLLRMQEGHPELEMAPTAGAEVH